MNAEFKFNPTAWKRLTNQFNVIKKWKEIKTITEGIATTMVPGHIDLKWYGFIKQRKYWWYNRSWHLMKESVYGNIAALVDAASLSLLDDITIIFPCKESPNKALVSILLAIMHGEWYKNKKHIKIFVENYWDVMEHLVKRNKCVKFGCSLCANNKFNLKKYWYDQECINTGELLAKHFKGIDQMTQEEFFFCYKVLPWQQFYIFLDKIIKK